MGNAEIWCLFNLPEEEAHMKFGSVTLFLFGPLEGMSLARPSKEMQRTHSSHVSWALSLSSLIWLAGLISGGNADTEFHQVPSQRHIPLGERWKESLGRFDGPRFVGLSI